MFSLLFVFVAQNCNVSLFSHTHALVKKRLEDCTNKRSGKEQRTGGDMTDGQFESTERVRVNERKERCEGRETAAKMDSIGRRNKRQGRSDRDEGVEAGLSDSQLSLLWLKWCFSLVKTKRIRDDTREGRDGKGRRKEKEENT